MKFEENPFRVLNVSIYDTKAKIDAQADDLSFADPDREEIIGRARDILLNPRKRIAAEMRWFVGCSREEEKRAIIYLLKNKFNEEDEDDDNDIDFSPLANFNYDIYYLEYEDGELTEWDISSIDDYYSELDAEEILEQINAARAKSKFPAVQDTKVINDELKNIRYEIREEIQERFKAMSHDERVNLADGLADITFEDDEDFGVIVEDFFECYKLEMTAFIDETIEKILELSEMKFDGKAIFSVFLRESEQTITAFVHARQPLDKFSMAIGRTRFDESEKVFSKVRNVAIKLYNEKNLIDEPLKIIHLLARNFSYLPKFAELIRKDVAFLEDAKKNRPTQTFLNSQATIKAIITAIDKELHFDKDLIHAHGNINFYLNVFKKRHEVTLLEIMSRTTYKPDERQILNSMAASIYLRVGNAITWTLNADWGLPLSLNSRIKLTYELFQNALVYAESSGDEKLISLARKRVNEWRGVVQQIERNSEENSSGCLWWIIGAGILLYLCSH